MLIVVFRGLLRMRSFSLAGRLRTEDIDSGCIKRVFDMSRVEPFDHLDAGAAILGDLVNVGTFHKPHVERNVVIENREHHGTLWAHRGREPLMPRGIHTRLDAHMALRASRMSLQITGWI
jgi:hypothetical protein